MNILLGYPLSFLSLRKTLERGFKKSKNSCKRLRLHVRKEKKKRKKKNIHRGQHLRFERHVTALLQISQGRPPSVAFTTKGGYIPRFYSGFHLAWARMPPYLPSPHASYLLKWTHVRLFMTITVRLFINLKRKIVLTVAKIHLDPRYPAISLAARKRAYLI